MQWESYIQIGDCEFCIDSRQRNWASKFERVDWLILGVTQLAMMMPLPWGAGRAMLGARDGRSAQPARCYTVTEQPENGVRS